MGILYGISGAFREDEYADRLRQMLPAAPGRLDCEQYEGAGLGIHAAGSPESIGLYAGPELVLAVDGYPYLTSDASTQLSGAYRRLSAAELATLWLRHGAGILNQIDGEFAMVIHVPTEGRLIMTSAIGGTRPIYFKDLSGQGLAFSTDLGALIRIKPTSTLDNQGLIDYLLFTEAMANPEGTCYTNVMRIRPGLVYEFAVGTDGRTTGPISRRAFWTAPATEDIALSPDAIRDSADQLRSLVISTVQNALTPRPSILGLSGGLDSTSIWVTLQHLAAMGSDAAASVEACSKVFPGESCDESELIAATERHTGRQSYKVDLSGENSAQHVTCLLQHFDFMPEPNAYQLCKYLPYLQARGNEVLLMGIGGDEWAASSLNYLADEWRKGQPLSAIRRAMSYGSWDAKPWSRDAVYRILSYVIAPPGSGTRKLLRSIRGSSGAAPPWLHSAHRDQYLAMLKKREQCREGSYARTRLFNILDWHGSYGIAGYAQFARSFGQEVRMPLMSRSLIEFAFRTPAKFLTHRGEREKELLRDAFSEMLPPQVRDRRYPTTFDTPEANDRGIPRMLGPARDWILADQGVIESAYVEKLRIQAVNGTLPGGIISRLCWAELFARKVLS